MCDLHRKTAVPCLGKNMKSTSTSCIRVTFILFLKFLLSPGFHAGKLNQASKDWKTTTFPKDAERKRKGMVEWSHLGVECRGSFVRKKKWQVLITGLINKIDNILSDPQRERWASSIEVLTRTDLALSQ